MCNWCAVSDRKLFDWMEALSNLVFLQIKLILIFLCKEKSFVIRLHSPQLEGMYLQNNLQVHFVKAKYPDEVQVHK